MGEAITGACAAGAWGAPSIAVGICDGVPIEVPHEGQNLWDGDNSPAQEGTLHGGSPRANSANPDDR